MTTTARRRQPFGLYVLIVPFVVMFALFFIAPIVYAIVDSMFSVKASGLGFGAPERIFVFVDNYVAALSSTSFVAETCPDALIVVTTSPRVTLATA